MRGASLSVCVRERASKKGEWPKMYRKRDASALTEELTVERAVARVAVLPPGSADVGNGAAGHGLRSAELVFQKGVDGGMRRAAVVHAPDDVAAPRAD